VSDAGPWTLGWDSLVAVGTVGLALATYLLVRSTRRLAQATADELRASWRPILLPDRAGPYPQDERFGEIVYDAEKLTLALAVHNSGRGPALYVRTHLGPGGDSPRHWSLGAIGANESVTLMFDNIAAVSPRQLLFDYRDIGGRTFSSEIVVDEVEGVRRFYDVHVYEDHTVTPLGDSVRQSGLEDVSPQARPPLGQRMRLAWRALRS
jgi:hypothetical protein